MRPRKFRLDDVVFFRDSHGAVVAYRADVKWGRYLVVRTDPIGRYPHGPAVWVDSTEMQRTPYRSKRAAVNYRKNSKLFDRGCDCNCCFHVSGFEPDDKE